nr:MAG TPA: hypothetical protein [Caudoviricetes sp.]
MYYPNMMNAQQTYQAFQNPYAMNMTPQTPTTLTRVTGIDGAKAYQMTPNSTVALFDNNEDIMYIKTTDGAGFPTIRTFAFNEVVANNNSVSENVDYVTRDEFNKLKEELLNGKQSISRSKSNLTTDKSADN